MNWIDEKIKEYYSWLRDNTFVKEDKYTGWYSISTPFLGLFNDNIEIYAKRDSDKIILSDDAETISSLRMIGVDFSKSKNRKEALDAILLNYGITLDANGELYIEAKEEDFSKAKHRLISAISEVSDLQITAKHTIASVFKEDVGAFLEDQGIIYTPSFIIKGSTGLEFNFDYLIAGKRTELVIKPFNSLTQGQVERFLFSWEDIKETRQSISKKELQGLAIVNDTINEPKNDLVEALRSKKAGVIFWSKRSSPESVRLLRAS